MFEKTNTAHLIALLKQKITRIENATAKGVNRDAAFEIAELSGMALRLHYRAEEELIEGEKAEEYRARQVRVEAAGRIA